MFKICFIHNLAKVDHFKFIPLGVMHHEPCRHAGSSTSVFLLGRIRKVSSLFLFFYSSIWAPRVGLDIAMGLGFKVGILLRR